MKTLLLLLITTSGFAQSSLTLTQNTTLGQNCGNGRVTDAVYRDVNLNGFNLELRNVNLQVTGDLNGPGQITRCGNYDHSNLCVAGGIQNNVNTGGLTCSTLSTDEFVFTPDNYGRDYTIFTLTGQQVAKGKTNEEMFKNLPVGVVLILKVEGFVGKKLIIE